MVKLNSACRDLLLLYCIVIADNKKQEQYSCKNVIYNEQIKLMMMMMNIQINKEALPDLRAGKKIRAMKLSHVAGQELLEDSEDYNTFQYGR